MEVEQKDHSKDYVERPERKEANQERVIL